MTSTIIPQCTPADPCDMHDPCPGHTELAAQCLTASVGTAFDLPTAQADQDIPSDTPILQSATEAGGQDADPRMIVPLYGGQCRAYWDDHIVGDYPSYHDADVALDAYQIGLLEDGLVDTVPASIFTDEPGARCRACGCRSICAPDGVIRCVACGSTAIDYTPYPEEEADEDRIPAFAEPSPADTCACLDPLICWCGAYPMDAATAEIYRDLQYTIAALAPDLLLARPAEEPALLYACACGEAAEIAPADPLTAAHADDPNLAMEDDFRAQEEEYIADRNASLTAPVKPSQTDIPAAPTAALTRAGEYNLALADAWHCSECKEIFFVEKDISPLSCPRCEHHANNPPLPLDTPVRCPACGGGHALSHCEELAREWRDQAQQEIRAGAAVGAHIARDLSGFIREYAALTEEQRAATVASYCAWQRAESRPAAVAKRWARMAGI